MIEVFRIETESPASQLTVTQPPTIGNTANLFINFKVYLKVRCKLMRGRENRSFKRNGF